jgi:hypothetical protein
VNRRYRPHRHDVQHNHARLDTAKGDNFGGFARGITILIRLRPAFIVQSSGKLIGGPALSQS